MNELPEAATEAVAGLVTEAVQNLDPIYSALWNIQTLAVAQVALLGLVCGCLCGLILWRWLK